MSRRGRPGEVEAHRSGRRAVYGAGLRVLKPVYERAGCAYLTGPDRTSALTLAERLAAEGSQVTLGYWPRKEESASSVAAEEYATLEALGDLVVHEDQAAVSLKAARLGFDFDLVRQLARLAAKKHIGLIFDAHTPAEADRTLALARAARGEGASTGVALPASWGRSGDDAAMASEFGLFVRVVKGQWPDDVPGNRPSGEAQLRSSFLGLLDRLADLDVRFTVATHDVVLLERALARLGDSDASPEVELLLGLPVRRALDSARRAGAATRFYISFGYPGLPYPFWAVLRRPRLAWLLTQGVILGGHNQAIQRRAAFG